MLNMIRTSKNKILNINYSLLTSIKKKSYQISLIPLYIWLQKPRKIDNLSLPL